MNNFDASVFFRSTPLLSRSSNVFSTTIGNYVVLVTFDCLRVCVSAWVWLLVFIFLPSIAYCYCYCFCLLRIAFFPTILCFCLLRGVREVSKWKQITNSNWHSSKDSMLIYYGSRFCFTSFDSQLHFTSLQFYVWSVKFAVKNFPNWIFCIFFPSFPCARSEIQLRIKKCILINMIDEQIECNQFSRFFENDYFKNSV